MPAKKTVWVVVDFLDQVQPKVSVHETEQKALNWVKKELKKRNPYRFFSEKGQMKLREYFDNGQIMEASTLIDQARVQHVRFMLFKERVR